MDNIENRLMQYVDNNKDELFSLLSELIKIDSQNFITHGNELACSHYIQSLYHQLGLQTCIYSPDDVPGIKDHEAYIHGRGLENRPNVSGILQGTETSSVMIAAHIDTMPIGDITKWTVDPFGGLIKNNRIWGLGAGDNKFGIAGSIFAIRVLRALGISLKKNVILTSYVDEEYGGGGGALAACLKYPCDVYVNLDGGNYEMWTASLGGGGYSIEVKSNSATDSATKIVNALYKIKSELEIFGERRVEELSLNSLYKGTNMERSAYRLLEFNCGSFGSNLDSGNLKFVIYTTLKKEDIERQLSDILVSLSPYFKENNLSVSGFIPTTRFFGFYTSKDKTGSISTMKKAADDVLGSTIKTTGACLSDLSIFLKYGSEESFNFGILRDFALYGGAHQPDEFVECDEFINHTKAILLFLVRYCGVA